MYLTHDPTLADMERITDVRHGSWWCPSCGLASEACRPVSEHFTSEGMVRYLWCTTSGWIVTRSDFQLIQVSGRSGERRSAKRGVS